MNTNERGNSYRLLWPVVIAMVFSVLFLTLLGGDAQASPRSPTAMLQPYSSLDTRTALTVTAALTTTTTITSSATLTTDTPIGMPTVTSTPPTPTPARDCSSVDVHPTDIFPPGAFIYVTVPPGWTWEWYPITNLMRFNCSPNYPTGVDCHWSCSPIEPRHGSAEILVYDENRVLRCTIGIAGDQPYCPFTPTPTYTPTSTGTATLCSPVPCTPTPTSTPTITPTPTSTFSLCGVGSQYRVAIGTATIVPGTTDIGNHCLHCITAINLPFTYYFYGQSFSMANVETDGTLQFSSTAADPSNTCLPASIFNNAILPYWNSLDTIGRPDICASYPNGQCGIFTSISGTAPNRIFNIEWRAMIGFWAARANFEVRLYEDPALARFDIIYGTVEDTGGNGTVGVQKSTGSGGLYTQYECRDGGSLYPGLQLTFSQSPCLPNTPGPTFTPAITPNVTPCSITFTDVHQADYFYQATLYLACQGAISGYSDGSFRPYNNTTRGQLSKIVVLAEGWPPAISGGPHFSDVPVSNPFYAYIETAYNHSVISGYSDGTFRWGNNVTRGQLSKIIVVAQSWPIDLSGAPDFNDVMPGSAFYDYVETASNHQTISGYSDGTFRPGNYATRGQISKIVYNAVTQLVRTYAEMLYRE